MSVKVTAKQKKKEPSIEYPCLMESTKTGRIVLFKSEKTGTELSSSDCGFHQNNWANESFVPFAGKLTLENE